MSERRKKIKQARIIEMVSALICLCSAVLRLFVIPDHFEVLRTIVSIIGSVALIFAVLYGWRRKKLICCPYCGVFLREEFIDSPQFTCLGCGKEVDNSKV